MLVSLRQHLFQNLFAPKALRPPSTIEFVARSMEVEQEEDVFDRGCIGRRELVEHASIDVITPTLRAMLSRVIDTYWSADLSHDDWRVRPLSPLHTEDFDGRFYLEYDRLEDKERNPIRVKSEDFESWKRGYLQAFTVTYTIYFHVREVRPAYISLENLREAACEYVF